MAPPASGACQAARAQELPRQPRPTPTPSSKPTPASPQISSGVTGVWRLDTAIGAATANPTLPPRNAPRRSATGSHRTLEPINTAAPMPTTPPISAPPNNPGFPAALPRIDPTTAPSPERTHPAMKRGNGFKRREVQRQPAQRAPLVASRAPALPGCLLPIPSHLERCESDLPRLGLRAKACPCLDRQLRDRRPTDAIARLTLDQCSSKPHSA